MEGLKKFVYKVPWWLYVIVGIVAVVLVDSYARWVGELNVATYLVNFCAVALVIAWAFPMAYATSPNYFGPGFLSGVVMSVSTLAVGIWFFDDKMTMIKLFGCVLAFVAFILFTIDKKQQRDEEWENKLLTFIHSLPWPCYLIIALIPLYYYIFIGPYVWWMYVVVGSLTTVLVSFYARLVCSAWKAYKVNVPAVMLITAWVYPLAYINAPTFFQAGLMFMLIAGVMRISVGVLILRNRFTLETGLGTVLAIVGGLLLK